MVRVLHELIWFISFLSTCLSSFPFLWSTFSCTLSVFHANHIFHGQWSFQSLSGLLCVIILTHLTWFIPFLSFDNVNSINSQLLPQAVQTCSKEEIFCQRPWLPLLPLIHGRLLPGHLRRRDTEAVPVHGDPEAHVQAQVQGRQQGQTSASHASGSFQQVWFWKTLDCPNKLKLNAKMLMWSKRQGKLTRYNLRKFTELPFQVSSPALEQSF